MTSTQDTHADFSPVFQHLLVTTDFSDASAAAFREAVRLARDLRARLTILHVFEYADLVPPEGESDLPEIREAFEAAQKAIDGLRQEAGIEGVAAEARISGGLASTIILESLASGVDLAILGTRAIRGLERLAFGSVAETVLRQSPCPVLTVGPLAAMPGRKLDLAGPVVFATDFHCTTTSAVALAASLGQMTHSDLHCIHVLPGFLRPDGAPAVIPGILAEALRRMAKEDGSIVNPSVCTVVYGNEVSNAVVEYARAHHARWIVLGVRQASLMAAHIPAHITYRIITEAPCPVLTMAFAQTSAATPAGSCRKTDPQSFSTASCESLALH